MRFVFGGLAALVILLFVVAGIDLVREAYGNPAPATVDCSRFYTESSEGDWLRLTDCRWRFPDAVFIAKKSGDVTDVYIPLVPSRYAGKWKVAVHFDAADIADDLKIGRLPPLDDGALEGMIERRVKEDHLRTIRSESASCAASIIVLEPGKHPSMGAGVACLILAVVGFVFTGVVLFRRPRRSRRVEVASDLRIPCPMCAQGHVEVVKEFWFLYGLVVIARYGSRTHAGCWSCVQREGIVNFSRVLVGGWWAIPWGIGTPFVLLQNLAVLALPGRAGLERMVAEALAARNGAPAPMPTPPPLPGFPPSSQPPNSTRGQGA